MQTLSETINIKKLRFYKNNPRKNDGSVAAVAESIKQCGYIAPIVVDENYIVLAGHTRLKALKKLGQEEVDIIVATGLTEAQKQKFRILDNKTAEFATWDIEKLISEIKGLDFEGFDFEFDTIGEMELPEEKPESEFVHISFTVHQAQKDVIAYAMEMVKSEITETFGSTNKNGNMIYEVVRQWAERKK